MLVSNTAINSESTFYEQDYCLWLENTLSVLRGGSLSELDIINLIAEIEYMVKSEKRALASNLEVLLMHLLKYQYQPEKRSNSWRYTILEHRDRIEIAFEDSPSLKAYFRQIFKKCYTKARKKASVETGLSLNIFPIESPFTAEETLNPDYLPD